MSEGQDKRAGRVAVPFASVEDAIARREDGGGRRLNFYDDLVAAHHSETAVELAKLVLTALGVEESVQKKNGVRTRYGNDVQAVAARVREARKRAGQGGAPAAPSGDRRRWAAEVTAIAQRDPASRDALVQALSDAGLLER
jgi:hypothetical protein